MQSAVFPGFAGGEKHLKQAAELSEELANHWPEDPEQLYLLTAYLANIDPVLITKKASAADAK